MRLQPTCSAPEGDLPYAHSSALVLLVFSTMYGCGRGVVLAFTAECLGVYLRVGLITAVFVVPHTQFLSTCAFDQTYTAGFFSNNVWVRAPWEHARRAGVQTPPPLLKASLVCRHAFIYFVFQSSSRPRFHLQQGNISLKKLLHSVFIASLFKYNRGMAEYPLVGVKENTQHMKDGLNLS